MKVLANAYTTLEEFQGELSRCQYREVEVLQTSNGIFESTQRVIRLGTTTLVDRQVRGSFIQRATLEKGVRRFVLSYGGTGVIVNGSEILENRLFFLAPGDHFCATVSEHAKAIVIGVEAKKLEPYFKLDELDALFNHSFLLRSDDILGEISRKKAALLRRVFAIFSDEFNIQRI